MVGGWGLWERGGAGEKFSSELLKSASFIEKCAVEAESSLLYKIYFN